MDEDKFNELQQFLETQANHAWLQTQKNPKAYHTVADTLGYNLELQLQINSMQLGNILNNLAQKSIEEALADIPDDPIDFSRYVRPSNLEGYKEVYVGEKWVVVPQNTCVDFVTTSLSMPNGSFDQGFKVTLYQEGTSDWVEFESNLTVSDYEQQLAADGIGISLQPIQFEEEADIWKDYGRPALNFSQKQVGFADDMINSVGVIAGDAFLRQHPKVRRDYSYKIHKKIKKAGVNIKPGKINTKAKDLAKLGRSGKLGSLTKITKPLGPLGNLLTAGVIVDEVFISDKWDAHTVVDGTLLVVGVVAAVYGAPIILAGIAVYGVLDYFFDIGKGLDTTIGRDSGIWEDRASKAPVDREALFKKALDDFSKKSPWEHTKVEIDKTAIKPISIKKPFKD